MRIRESRSQSEQPSLQQAQRSEKHELESMTAGEALFQLPSFSHALLDQHDAQRTSTAPSTTKSKELPEKEADKEVAVRSVNPSLANRDGEERMTSVANALKVQGDVGTEKHGQGSKELKAPSTLLAAAIAQLQRARNLNPALNPAPSPSEERKSDSELPTAIHPSSAPESSLLHVLYLQLLGAGRDGITVRELFKCLKEPAEIRRFECDWKEQVRWHLRTNPHFCEAKGYHYLVCNHQLEVQQPSDKRSPANIASTAHRYGESSSKAVLPSQHSTPATVQPGLSLDAHEGALRPRRKAFQKAVVALSEQATESEEMLQNMGDMQIMPSSVADPTYSQLVSHGPPFPVFRKRRSSLAHDEELPHHGHPIPGGLQATQAAILPETGVQTGQRCVLVQKDDTRNGRCNNMAMAGHTLCKDHRSLLRQVDGKTSLSPSPSSPSIAPEADVVTKGQYRHHKKILLSRWLQECAKQKDIHEGPQATEHGKQLGEERKAHQHADAQQGNKQGATTNLQQNQGLPGSHTNLGQSSLSLHPKSAPISPLGISREDSPSLTEAAKNFHKPAAGVSHHDDDSNGEQQMPKRRYVAARKTAANVGPLKSEDLIRTPAVLPLPPPGGIRRKNPANNTDQ